MRWLGSILLVAAITGLALAARHLVALPDVEMLYLLAIVVAALGLGRGPALLASALSVAAYDLFFVLPFYTFRVADVRFLITFAMMFGIGILVSTLVARLRRQEQAAAVRESRAALLSAVSHDLRTPLAAITGAATTLRDDALLDAGTRAELLETVCEEAERLERLVGNLLDMTRLGAGALVTRKEWVPFDELVGVALARLEGPLTGRAVSTVSPSDLPLVPCDPLLIEQVLINLVDNACKHTPPGSPLEIAARAGDGAIEIEVCDRGPGLPPGDAERLLDAFARGPSPGVPGAGLGLAICRGIALAHGGTLAATPRAGGGACFRLTLPLGGEPPAMPEPEA